LRGAAHNGCWLSYLKKEAVRQQQISDDLIRLVSFTRHNAIEFKPDPRSAEHPALCDAFAKVTCVVELRQAGVPRMLAVWLWWLWWLVDMVVTTIVSEWAKK
jgi:hypothetical protein